MERACCHSYWPFWFLHCTFLLACWSLCCRFVREFFNIIFWISTLCQLFVLKIFLLTCELSFCFLSCSLLKKIFYFLYQYSSLRIFLSCLRNGSLPRCCIDIFSIFASKCFKLLLYTCKSLNGLTFIFMYHMRTDFSFPI